MSTSTLLEQLSAISNAERLLVIEEATRLIRRDLGAGDGIQQEDRLRKAAVAAQGLYEPGGDLTEWTALDAEEVLDEPVTR